MAQKAKMFDIASLFGIVKLESKYVDKAKETAIVFRQTLENYLNVLRVAI